MQSLGRDTVTNDNLSDPYRTSKLLAAGAITLSTSPNCSLHELPQAEDGWSYFRSEQVIPCLANAEDEALCRRLEFLIRNEFLVAHCMLGQSQNQLYVRIYLIPFDLAGVRGKLRNRNEVKVMRPARLALRAVLPSIMRDRNTWYADDMAQPSGSRTPFFNNDVDNRSLAELYSDLPSPRIHPPSDSHGGPLIQHVLSGGDIEGLHSRLYPYQRETVAAMLQKELQPVDIPDPLYIPLSGLDGSVFYLQPGTMELLKDQPMVSQVKGGILCEELGTGKTVMCLALILATVDQLSKPEPSCDDVRPVLTPISLCHFHGEQVQSVRKKMSGGSPGSGLSIPTLYETLLHYIRVHPDGLHLRHYEDSGELANHWIPLELNSPFYYQHNNANFKLHARRNSSDPGPCVVYLTSATLVVVPPNLLGQWSSEIQKHCDPSVRVLIVQPQQQLPRARHLASYYDIILLNHDSFAKEAAKADTHKLHSWKMCSCPPYQDTRIPDCSCDIVPGVSPLLQLRWKRLVVDEGHVHGNDKTRISMVAQLLTVERRWLVSGTPTTNLLGLSFGSNSELLDENGWDLLYPSEEGLLQASNVDLGQDELLEVGGQVARVWTSRDRDNLQKLKKMIAYFLKVPQFANLPSLFDTHVIQPLFGVNGPLPGAIQILEQVMQSVMIRHQIADVEKDIVLPPLRHETILLDLHPLAAISYNALQGAIAINAVDSERVDQDYLFHSSNAARLQQLVENMSQLMFWHVDENLFNVEELCQASPSMVEKATERGVSSSDLKLIKDAIRHITFAATNSVWCWVQKHPFPDIPFTITDMPTAIFHTWSEMPFASHSSSTTLSGLMFPSRIAKLRAIVAAHPLISTDSLIEQGVTFIEEEKRLFLILMERAERAKKQAKSKHQEEDQREVLKATDTARHSEAPAAVDESLTQPIADLPLSGVSSQRRAFLLASPLANVHIGNSASVKLDYLLNEVLQYSKTEKFLIFSKSPLTLAHVADGLNLAHVKFLQYTTKVPLQQREQLVITFETSETYRVFLMELKHGSRGLNLVSASRVIFCEPVWQADVEAQAIKRAHRIGQTRPISVKTLAIRNTAEEVMMARRSELKDQAQREKQNANVTDDFRMRSFIANPKFIEGDALTRRPESVRLDIPFLDIPPEPAPPPTAPEVPVSVEQESHAVMAAASDNAVAGPSRLEGTGFQPRAEGGTEEASPMKKRRTVRFMDE
ncbi:hypothetical protein DENSPDRAFT_795695 [Dentipellis sp. KUC8613]|nr:hypothetical protein DENSPDRAFT_795695 [Dentipellis sp. KUC8613]